VVIFFS